MTNNKSNTNLKPKIKSAFRQAGGYVTRKDIGKAIRLRREDRPEFDRIIAATQMHLWMNTAPEIRRRELQSYVSTLEPIRTGTMLLLRIFRANSHCQSLTAVNGTYQFSMNRNQNCALVQIWLPADSTVVPEVSANKYMLWIRFSRPDENHKLHLARTEEIPFRLGLCTPS